MFVVNRQEKFSSQGRHSTTNTLDIFPHKHFAALDVGMVNR